MVFSNRERYVGIAVAAAVAVFAIDRYLWTPYTERLAVAHQKLEEASLKEQQAALVVRQQKELKPVWAQMRSEGRLVPNESEAEGQLAASFTEWADESGVRLSGRRSEQPIKEGDFFRIGYQVSGTGSTAAVSRFLWHVETAKLPIRVNEMSLNARRENTDDLTVRLTVSTLSIVPTNETADRPPAGAAPATNSTSPNGERPGGDRPNNNAAPSPDRADAGANEDAPPLAASQNSTGGPS